MMLTPLLPVAVITALTKVTKNDRSVQIKTTKQLDITTDQVMTAPHAGAVKELETVSTSAKSERKIRQKQLEEQGEDLRSI